MKTTRPLGIHFLTGLHLLGSLLGAGLLVFYLIPLLAEDPKLRENLTNRAYPPALMSADLVALLLLGFATGLGLLLGRCWGRYLGSFFYLHNALRRILAVSLHLVGLHMLPPGAFAMKPWAHLKPLGPMGIQLALFLLVYLYFFKRNVRDYFGLAAQPAWRPVAAQLALGIAVVAAYCLVQALLLR